MSDSDAPSLGQQIVKGIDEGSVRFLAAGEKINDIETAIRELVENSIDAEARNIEVRLSRYGIDSIEVDDNGTGIDEKNFPSLGKRYHTSKISDFQNLQNSLDTYGFRGEALSCLCSIANVTITTKTKTSPCGWRLTFREGKSVKQEPMGRDTGTTIILKNLFHSMAVRRRELETTAKKQYDRIVRLLYEQALARPHIKFSLCKKTAAKKDKDFTHGGTTLEGCLITIFGCKLMDTIIPIKQTGQTNASETISKAKVKDSEVGHTDNLPSNNGSSPHDDLSSNLNKTQPTHTHDCELISNPTSVSESNASVYDINVADDTCKSNGTANIDQSLPSTLTGVEFTQSVAPSRDQIFYKRSRKSRFSRDRPCYTVYGYISKVGYGRNSTDHQYIFVNDKPCELPRVTRLVNEIYRSFNVNANNHYPFLCLFIEVQKWATDFNVPRKRGVILQEENKLYDILKETLETMYSSFAPADQKSCPSAKIPLISKFVNKSDEQKPKPSEDERSSDQNPKTNSVESTISKPPTPVQRSKSDSGRTDESGQVRFEFESLSNGVVNSIPDSFEVAPKRARTSASSTTPTTIREPLRNNTANNATTTGFRNGLDLFAEETAATGQQDDTQSTCNSNGGGGLDKHLPVALATFHPKQKGTSPAKRMAPPPEPICRFNQNALMQDNDLKVAIEFFEDLPFALERERHQQALPDDERKFSFAISPQFNSPAVDELKCHLNKSSFSGMQVIGQFNRGFIIARLNKHLFIIDQHATDERANYEEQLEKSPLVPQPMVHAKPLYLNLIQENAILNNIEAFRQRGLQFKVDPEKLTGYRVMLVGTSICRGPDREEHLGKDDIEELVDVCIESPNSLESYTLSKVKTVSASVACRKSVMIGDKLTWSQMDRIVGRMSNLQNPWVCAHNRPTIRHLMDTDWMDDLG